MIAGQNRYAGQMRLDRRPPEAFPPKRRHQKDRGAGIDRPHILLDRRDRDVGQRRQIHRGLAQRLGCGHPFQYQKPHVRTPGQRPLRQGDQHRQALARHGIDMGDEPRLMRPARRTDRVLTEPVLAHDRVENIDMRPQDRAVVIGQKPRRADRPVARLKPCAGRNFRVAKIENQLRARRPDRVVQTPRVRAGSVGDDDTWTLGPQKGLACGEQAVGFAPCHRPCLAAGGRDHPVLDFVAGHANQSVARRLNSVRRRIDPAGQIALVVRVEQRCRQAGRLGSGLRQLFQDRADRMGNSGRIIQQALGSDKGDPAASPTVACKQDGRRFAGE